MLSVRIKPYATPNLDEWTIIGKTSADPIEMPTSEKVWSNLRPSVQRALLTLASNGRCIASSSDRMLIGGALMKWEIPLDQSDSLTISMISAVGIRENEARLVDPIRQSKSVSPLDASHLVGGSGITYRPDFYIPRNVIGYTGNLDNYPSIYFRTSTEIGHITQKHKQKKSVGRWQVAQLNHAEYITETSVGGKYFEFWSGFSHMSRGQFTPIEGAQLERGTPETRAILLAIMRYPFEKNTPDMEMLLTQAEDQQWFRTWI